MSMCVCVCEHKTYVCAYGFVYMGAHKHNTYVCVYGCVCIGVHEHKIYVCADVYLCVMIVSMCLCVFL